MRWTTFLAAAAALCLVTTAHADMWVETYDVGAAPGFNQVWTPHDWAVASELTPVGVTGQHTISAATGGADTSYYGVYAEDRNGLGVPMSGSEDTGEFPIAAGIGDCFFAFRGYQASSRARFPTLLKLFGIAFNQDFQFGHSKMMVRGF